MSHRHHPNPSSAPLPLHDFLGLHRSSNYALNPLFCALLHQSESYLLTVQLLAHSLCVYPGWHPERFPISPLVTRHSFTLSFEGPLSSRKSLRINTYKTVSKQRTLTALRINTYAKTGGGSNPAQPCPAASARPREHSRLRSSFISFTSSTSLTSLPRCLLTSLFRLCQLQFLGCVARTLWKLRFAKEIAE
jgi:hypothetical protein